MGEQQNARYARYRKNRAVRKEEQQRRIVDLEAQIAKLREENYALHARISQLEESVPAHARKKKDEPIGPSPHIELMPRRSGPYE
jgi:cell division protein FtsB